MITHQDREADAAQRLLAAVERLTGERAGEMHQRDTGAVYTRMAELIERAMEERVALVAYARIVERYARASPLTPWIDGLRAEAGVQRIMEASDGE